MILSGRPVAALLCLALSACSGTSGSGSGGASAPSASPGTAEGSSGGTAARTAAASAPLDPVAPVASTDYATTLAERSESLMQRGLRIGASDVGYYMDVQEARLRQLGGTSLRLTRRDQSVVVELPGPLNFEVGSAQLSSSARLALTGVARVLVDYRFTIISVEGHTDDSGDAAKNLELSEQRAAAVARQLVSGGVEPTRFVVVGRGSVRPIGDNATEVGREANRRVVLRIDPLKR
jgi:outer membrane protein OmpA-like peptidoglycan-associated protein